MTEDQQVLVTLIAVMLCILAVALGDDWLSYVGLIGISLVALGNGVALLLA